MPSKRKWFGPPTLVLSALLLFNSTVKGHKVSYACECPPATGLTALLNVYCHIDCYMSTDVDREKRLRLVRNLNRLADQLNVLKTTKHNLTESLLDNNFDRVRVNENARALMGSIRNIKRVVNDMNSQIAPQDRVNVNRLQDDLIRDLGAKENNLRDIISRTSSTHPNSNRSVDRIYIREDSERALGLISQVQLKTAEFLGRLNAAPIR